MLACSGRDLCLHTSAICTVHAQYEHMYIYECDKCIVQANSASTVDQPLCHTASITVNVFATVRQCRALDDVYRVHQEVYRQTQ
jgi:hypothetical protein